VVIRSPIKNLGVNVGPCRAGETFEEIVHQFGLQVSHQPGANFCLDHRCGASAEVHGNHCKRLVHRHHEVSGPHDPAAASQCTIEGFPHGYTNVLNRVVLIDIKVPACANIQIESAVASEQLQHVIQKTYTGRDVILSATLKRELDLNIGLGGLSFHYALPSRSVYLACSS
jgi:hypothetical protein